MTITICRRSAVAGLLAGLAAMGVAWYGTALASRADITRQLLTTARCDPAGFTSITFVDGSQFTCVPAQQMPPTSREEARRRAGR